MKCIPKSEEKKRDTFKNWQSIKNPQSLSNLHKTWWKWLPHDAIISTKLHKDWTKIVDFLLMANFWMCPVFLLRPYYLLIIFLLNIFLQDLCWYCSRLVLCNVQARSMCQSFRKYGIQIHLLLCCPTIFCSKRLGCTLPTMCNARILWIWTALSLWQWLHQ